MSYNTSPKNREHYDDLADWKKAVHQAGGDFRKKDDGSFEAHAHDGFCGEFKGKAGWLVDKWTMKEGSPSDFAKPEIKFKKLDDLPNKGKGPAYSPSDIMIAMKALHKMIHAQAAAYGGPHSKLLPAGIAETSLLKSVVNGEPETLDEGIDSELEAAYQVATSLQEQLKNSDDMKLVLKLIGHVNKALSLASKC